MKNTIHTFLYFPIIRPWLCIVSVLLIAAILASGARNLGFDGDPRRNVTSNNTQLLEFSDLEETYGSTDGVFFVIESTNGSLFTNNYLSLIENLTNEFWEIDHVSSVNSISNYQHSYTTENGLQVNPLVEKALSLNSKQIDQVRKIALAEPILLNRLINPSGNVSALIIQVTLPEGAPKEQAESDINYRFKDIADRLEKSYPDLNVYLTGSAISNVAQKEGATKDLSSQIPLMYLLIFSLLAIFLRSTYSVVSIIVVTMTAVTVSMGAAGWMGYVLNFSSIIANNIILTICIAHCVHIISHIIRNSAQTNNKGEAINTALHETIRPVFLTSITTMIGFLSMNFSEFQPAHDLGNIVSVGIIFIFILSYTLLPAMMRIFPYKKDNTSISHMANMSAKYTKMVLEHRHFLFYLSIPLAIVVLSFVKDNIYNDNFMELQKEPNEFRSNNDFVDRIFGGLYTIEYSLDSGMTEGISNPDYLHHVESMTQWLRDQPEIISVVSYTDIIKKINRNMHGDDPVYFRIPKDRKTAAQLLMLFEISMSPEINLDNILSSDRSASRLIVTLPSTDTVGILALQKKTSRWMNLNLPETMQHPGTSLLLMISTTVASSVISNVRNSFIALLIVCLLIALIMRSMKYGAVSFLPNLLPAAYAFGVWGMTYGQLGMQLSTTLGITIGIIVDDTVHVISRYADNRQNEKLASTDALIKTFREVGPALIITSAVLVIGFLSLIASQFIPNIEMGIMTALIIATALFLDFTFLPIVLYVFDTYSIKEILQKLKPTRNFLPTHSTRPLILNSAHPLDSFLKQSFLIPPSSLNSNYREDENIDNPRERRIDPRYILPEVLAQIISGGRELSCQLIDFSKSGGLCIRINAALPKETNIILKTSRGSPMHGHILWSTNHKAGIMIAV